MRFKEFLEEAFDQPYPYTWITHYSDNWKGKFNSGSSTVNVEFELNGWKPTISSWEIYFDTNGSIEKTGEGDQFRILATVMTMISELVAEKHPDEITFSALKSEDETDSRSRLYLKICDRFAAANGYTINTKEKDVDMGHGITGKKTNFILTKI